MDSNFPPDPPPPQNKVFFTLHFIFSVFTFTVVSTYRSFRLFHIMRWSIRNFNITWAFFYLTMLELARLISPLPYLVMDRSPNSHSRTADSSLSFYMIIMIVFIYSTFYINLYSNALYNFVRTMRMRLSVYFRSSLDPLKVKYARRRRTGQITITERIPYSFPTLMRILQRRLLIYVIEHAEKTRKAIREY